MKFEFSLVLYAWYLSLVFDHTEDLNFPAQEEKQRNFKFALSKIYGIKDACFVQLVI